MDDLQCIQLQIEFTTFMDEYFEQKLGQKIKSSTVTIGEDMVFIRGQGFLTEPEKYIAQTAAGREVVNTARIQVARQHSVDNVPYFELRLDAKVIHQAFNIEAENDFWMHIMVFDRVLY